MTTRVFRTFLDLSLCDGGKIQAQAIVRYRATMSPRSNETPEIEILGTKLFFGGSADAPAWMVAWIEGDALLREALLADSRERDLADAEDAAAHHPAGVLDRHAPQAFLPSL